MWFNTRVGLGSVAEPSEILVSKIPKDNTGWIFFRLKALPEVTTGMFLKGSSTISSPCSQWAAFSDGPAVSKAIAECMARSEDSIRTKAEVCDLSQSGDPQAWGKAWQQVQWPSGNPDPL
jgi:hypothetical protein